MDKLGWKEKFSGDDFVRGWKNHPVGMNRGTCNPFLSGKEVAPRKRGWVGEGEGGGLLETGRELTLFLSGVPRRVV